MDFILDGFARALELLAQGDEATFSAVAATLKSTVLAMAAALLLGAPAGFCLGHFQFRGRRTLRLVTDTALSFPTVVIGLLVYAFVSRRGPLGDLELLYSVSGMAIGLTILGLPIVTALTASAVEHLDVRLKPTLLTMGAAPWQVVATTLWEIRFGIMLAAMAAFGRIVSEVGIAMIVGGNIKWHTRTITTAIALETSKGEFAMGIALGLVLMVVAFAVNISVSAFRRISEK
ncbi:MAG TPA: ABC transporter permease [Desulfovibrio sp.]|nr:ABC transporter permease [Desulfovibrio sp.]